MTDNELIDKATTAYKRWCQRNGFEFSQPGQQSEVIHRGDWYDPEIVLANVKGELARYRWNGEMLLRLNASMVSTHYLLKEKN